MKKTVLLMILALCLSGCMANTLYTISPEEYTRQVKTLGVLPILIDAESIQYESREELFSLLEISTAAVQQPLVEKLRRAGRHFDVRPVVGDPQVLRSRLLADATVVGEAAATRIKYTFDSQGSSQLADEAVVDALLVVVVHGVKRQEKRWSSFSLRMDYLWADYSSLLYTAAIIDPTGRVLWQLDQPPGEVMLMLDYPDFTEAYWNRTETVRIKPITLTGLQRTLQEPELGLMVDKEIPKLFSRMIDRIVQQMKR